MMSFAVLRRTNVSRTTTLDDRRGRNRTGAPHLPAAGNICLVVVDGTSVGPAPPDEPPVGMALLNLTGEQRSTTLQLAIPGTVYGLTVAPLVVNLRKVSAPATLAVIASGQTGRLRTAVAALLGGRRKPGLHRGMENWVAMNGTGRAAPPDVSRSGARLRGTVQGVGQLATGTGGLANARIAGHSRLD